jgi:hypothetical protein
MKALVSGAFSFVDAKATAGDLMACDLICEWLDDSGIAFDVASVPPFGDGVDWRTADPSSYGAIVCVCGPFGWVEPLSTFLTRFQGIPIVGVNLSLFVPLSLWNPFQAVFQRDGFEASRPDMVFLSQREKVPVIGVIKVHEQPEYGKRGRHEEASAAIDRLTSSAPGAVVNIDTRLDINAAGLRTPDEVEALISRMDVVLTTRLHGLVLALKNGIPAIAIDAIAGGAKVTSQAGVLDWPFAFTVDSLTDQALRQAFDDALSEEGHRLALAAADRAREILKTLPSDVVAAVRGENAGDRPIKGLRTPNR